MLSAHLNREHVARARLTHTANVHTRAVGRLCRSFTREVDLSSLSLVYRTLSYDVSRLVIHRPGRRLQIARIHQVPGAMGGTQGGWIILPYPSARSKLFMWVCLFVLSSIFLVGCQFYYYLSERGKECCGRDGKMQPRNGKQDGDQRHDGS